MEKLARSRLVSKNIEQQISDNVAAAIASETANGWTMTGMCTCAKGIENKQIILISFQKRISNQEVTIIKNVDEYPFEEIVATLSSEIMDFYYEITSAILQMRTHIVLHCGYELVVGDVSKNTVSFSIGSRKIYLEEPPKSYPSNVQLIHNPNRRKVIWKGKVKNIDFILKT